MLYTYVRISLNVRECTNVKHIKNRCYQLPLHRGLLRKSKLYDWQPGKMRNVPAGFAVMVIVIYGLHTSYNYVR